MFEKLKHAKEHKMQVARVGLLFFLPEVHKTAFLSQV